MSPQCCFSLFILSRSSCLCSLHSSITSLPSFFLHLSSISFHTWFPSFIFCFLPNSQAFSVPPLITDWSSCLHSTFLLHLFGSSTLSPFLSYLFTFPRFQHLYSASSFTFTSQHLHLFLLGPFTSTLSYHPWLLFLLTCIFSYSPSSPHTCPITPSPNPQKYPQHLSASPGTQNSFTDSLIQLFLFPWTFSPFSWSPSHHVIPFSLIPPFLFSIPLFFSSLSIFSSYFSSFSLPLLLFLLIQTTSDALNRFFLTLPSSSSPSSPSSTPHSLLLPSTSHVSHIPPFTKCVFPSVLFCSE